MVAALVLTLLGGLLAIAGIGWAAVVATTRRRQLRAERETILREHASEPKKEASERLRQLGIPFTTWGDLLTVRQDTEIAILSDALSNLRGPALVVVLGGVLSTVGGVLGLWA